jgi:NHLM bacteriocin system ABC transporter ATP-binding protein
MANSEHAELAKARELFFLGLRYREGELTDRDSRQPVFLARKDTALIVYRGRADVFAVPLRNDDQTNGPRHHLFRAESSQALFGWDTIPEANAERDGMPEANRWGLVAVGTPGTQLLEIPRAILQELAQTPEDAPVVADLLAGWIQNLTTGLVEAVPRDSRPLAAGKAFGLSASQSAHCPKGVTWVKSLEGRVSFAGRANLALPEASYVPLAAGGWLRAASPAQLHALDGPSYLAQDPAWAGLDAFHFLAQQLVEDALGRALEQERELLTRQMSAERATMEDSMLCLAAVAESHRRAFLPGPGGQSQDALLAACHAIESVLGAAGREPPRLQGKTLTLDQIARAFRLRTRQVRLEGSWWEGDNGPLLAYTTPDRHPVALLPVAPRGVSTSAPHSYRLFDPTLGTTTRVTPDLAAQLDRDAWMFYRTLPARPLQAWDLMRLGIWGTGRDLAMVFLMGLAGGLLGLVAPLAIGYLIDTIVPEAARGQLLQLMLALMVVALVTGAFQLTRALAMLRVEMRTGTAVQAAAFDRLLNLPVSFFRGYAAGDLAERALGVETIRQTLSGVAVSSLLSGIFSIFSFALLFYLDTRLALLATLLALIAVLVTTYAGYAQVRHQRVLVGLQGRIAGLILQTITGLAKFRGAGAEARGFARWAREFAEQRRRAFKARTVANHLAIFNSSYPLLVSAVIFWVVGTSQEAAFSTGTFLAFFAAFTQFLNATMQIGQAGVSLLSIVPVYERAKPIFQTVPEVDEAKADPGELTGGIELRRVSFRYGTGMVAPQGLATGGPDLAAPGHPLVLKNVSLYVKPGEFIAIVGPSGSGKSTLFRLLLGFETPETGAVYFDARDLAGLDLHALRRQIGVVLQNSQLMAGTIFENIAGGVGLTQEAAWEAVRQAGLERDIRQLPMALHTYIGVRGGTLSGGQRQKLLIARAIARQPSILFFDEATSALDNETQAQVMHGLEQLHVTRIVIAHRLSTIMHADRIYVLVNGELMQSGAYEELINQPGPFFDLSQRQLI